MSYIKDILGPKWYVFNIWKPCAGYDLSAEISQIYLTYMIKNQILAEK